MGWKGLERNKLDYILTDLLPVELSELFSFRLFYDFLLRKDNYKKLECLLEKLKQLQAKSNATMFIDSWATMPLKYRILKGNDSMREMSIIQPLSALNIYLFMECYQKDILNFFNVNHCFSIRYHKKSTELYYKSRSGQATQYFQSQAIRVGKAAVQQTGSYFNIAPFESTNSFTDSRIWRLNNFQFRYFAKIDYKSCFDSIYSHVYKWIVERNVIDSKDAHNSNLFITIDRIIQNINGRSSNGLVVGPEFSRMIAEILLQQVDSQVQLSLLQGGLERGKDYAVFRYVDDIFIFASSQENIDSVIKTYREIGDNYLLRLNELKLEKSETPCQPKIWLERTRNLSDVIQGFFFEYKKSEYDSLPKEQQYLIKDDNIPVDRIKDEFTALMNDYPDDRRTIVSFLLSTMLNKISKKKDGFKLFKAQKVGKALLLIDLAFFMYAYFPSFDQTRKIISMIVYMNSEVDFSSRNSYNAKLQKAIRRYAFIFERGNLPDLCDWFVLFREFKIYLEVNTENIIFEKARIDNNLITWANLLLYSTYYEPLFNEMSKYIENVVKTQISKMSSNEMLMQVEFWYAIVFHNCPYISASLKNEISANINKISTSLDSLKPSSFATLLICDFLQQSKSGKKPLESFFNWSSSRNVSEQITFRTYQRSIFKRYKTKYGIYSSIE